MLGQFVKLALVYLAQLQGPAGPTENPEPVFIEQRPIVQRPLDGSGREILTCSLPLNADCQTSRGKSYSSYCSCAENLICQDNKCVRENPSNTSPVFEGPSIRIDEIAPEVDAKIQMVPDPQDGLQRPLAPNGGLIISCSLPLDSKCKTGTKSQTSYCRCAEDMTCTDHRCVRTDPNSQTPVLEGQIRINSQTNPNSEPIVQRPIRHIEQKLLDSNGNEISREDCRLPPGSRCMSEYAKTRRSYCLCALDHVCRRGRCVPE